MRFGVETLDRPAGMMHPAGFAAIEEVVDAAVEAERLGYDDAGGNDHLSTKRSPRHDASRAPGMAYTEQPRSE